MIKINKILLFINIMIVVAVIVVSVARAWTNPLDSPPTGKGALAGAVWFFNTSSCPDGWSEFVLARGRYVVGLNNSGTLKATVGTALTNKENRAVGQHNHTATLANAGSHTHNIYFDDDWPGSQTAIYELDNIDTSWHSQFTQSVGSHSHTLTIDAAGTVSGTNAPYIQLLACRKN